MGHKIKTLESSPELRGEQWTYFECYTDLGPDRISGLSLGSIPWTSVVSWCHLHGITDSDDVDDYVAVISKADRMLLDSLDKKGSTISNDPSAKGKGVEDGGVERPKS